MKAKVELDFDTISLITLELEGENIESICEQVDRLENKILDWGEKNFPETTLDRIKNRLGIQTHRAKRDWNPKIEVKEYLEKPNWLNRLT